MGAFDESAFDVGAFDEGTTTPFTLAPMTLRGRPALAHTFQFFAGRPFTPAPAPQPPRHFFPEPGQLRGRPALAHTFQFFATSPGIKTTILSGFGAAGAATFILALEPGGKIINEWQTNIITAYDGTEQRESSFGPPRRHIEASAFLLDAASRDARGALQRSAAAGSTFLLALPHEDLVFSADSTGQTVTVPTTTLCDWAVASQRVAIIGVDGVTLTAVVQAVTATTLRLDVTPGTTGRRGGRIVPLLPVVLEPQQGFARYPVNVDLWTVRAQANAFGWCGQDRHGVGALITTFTAGSPIPVATVTEFDVLIWDRVNSLDGTAPEAMLSGAEVLDRGGLPSGAGAASAPNWARSLKCRLNTRADWQFWKAFTRLCRGRQRTWLLSTNRPDLVFDSAIGGGIKVKSSSTAGGGDYVSWFAADGRGFLALTKTDRSVQYVQVLSLTDNLDGTLTLALDATVTGTIGKISFLELVRFERDALEAVWTGTVFAVDEHVIAVQDAVEVPSRFLFDTELTVNFAYSGVPPDVPPVTQELAIPFGKAIIVHWTSDRSLNFCGIHMAGGNVDGTVVCVANVNTTSSSIILQYDDANAVPGDRLYNSGLSSVTGVARATWYRYRQAAAGGTGRWIQFM